MNFYKDFYNNTVNTPYKKMLEELMLKDLWFISDF